MADALLDPAADCVVDRDLEALVRLATRACDAPMAVLVVGDGGDGSLVVAVGFDPAQASLPRALGAHASRAEDVVAVHDARADLRFEHDPMVVGAPRVRGCAGALVRGQDDEPCGIVCVLDPAPRAFDALALDLLRALARQAAIVLERRRTPAALPACEADRRVLFESNPQPLWVYDLETLRFLAVNDAAIERYGYSRAEFLAMTIADIRPREDVPALLENVARVRGGLDHAGLWRHRRKDGSILSVEITSHALTFRGRRAELVLAYDVTERLAVEEAVRENQALLQIASRVAKLGAWTVDVPSFVHRWTDETRALHELESHEPKPEVARLFECYLPSDRGRVRAAFERCARDGTPFDEELRFVTLKGRSTWVRVTGEAARDASGAIVRVQGALQDISERKAAEATLAASEERLRLLARVAHDAIWERDFVSGVKRWHEGIDDLLAGRSEPDDLDGLGHVHPDDRERVRESLRRVLDGTGTEWTEEYRVVGAEGVSHVLDRAHVVRDAEGRAVRAIGGIKDVTDRKRLEQQLLRSQRLESIGTLAGGIAHDLNNVLAPILMSLWTLREGETDPGRIDDLATLEACAQRGADMVHQLLSFARGSEPEPTAVDLGRVATELRRILADSLPPSITMALHVPVDLWKTRGDATQMHQLLTNFCVNARDAMPRGGRLTMRLDNVVLEERSSVLGPVPRPGPHVRVTIEDTGIGMPAELLDRIFEPFFTTKEVGKGTGLGLSTAHAIVRRHQGLVHAHSEVGRGSRFEIYLPAERSETHAHSVAPSAPRHASGPRAAMVLMVDDDAAIRRVASRVLERAGYRVLVAAHGAEAVSIFAQHRESIDVVVLDMRMPVMDGPATVIALRTMRPDVRLVAASGFDPEGQLASETDVGSAVFLAKPYTAEALLAAVEGAIAVPA